MMSHSNVTSYFSYEKNGGRGGTHDSRGGGGGADKVGENGERKGVPTTTSKNGRNGRTYGHPDIADSFVQFRRGKAHTFSL